MEPITLTVHVNSNNSQLLQIHELKAIPLGQKIELQIIGDIQNMGMPLAFSIYNLIKVRAEDLKVSLDGNTIGAATFAAIIN